MSEAFDLHGTPPGPEREHGYPHLWPVEDVRDAEHRFPTRLERVVANGFAIGMTQADSEALEAAAFIRDVIQPANIMELGTCCGGWLYVMHQMGRPGLRISVDRPWNQRDPKPKWPPYLLEEQLPTLWQMFGDIHDPEIRDTAWKAWERREPFLDLLFIDADHSYEGTAKHWEMYGPMVRPGGWIGFHDTANGWACGRFANEMAFQAHARQKQTKEFVYDPAPFGIGFVQK